MKYYFTFHRNILLTSCYYPIRFFLSIPLNFNTISALFKHIFTASPLLPILSTLKF